MGPDDDHDLATRLARLERRLRAVERGVAPPGTGPEPRPSVPPPEPARPAVPPSWYVAPPSPATASSGPAPLPPPPQPPPVPVPARPEPSGPELDAEVLLKWAGIGLVTLAALFLVSTAISRGWIGPRLQLAVATAGGAALLATALRLPGERRPWSVALAHGGLVVLGGCAGAAHAWLDVVSLPVSVALVAGVVGAAVPVADRLHHANLLTNGLVLGLAVPGVITAYGVLGPAFAAPWLVALVAVAAAMAWLRTWWVPRLVVLALVGPSLVAIAGQAQAESVGVGTRLVVQLAVVAAALAWWSAPWLRPSPGSWRWVETRLVMALPGLVWLTSSLLWFADDLVAFEWSSAGGSEAAPGPALAAGLVALGFAAAAAVGRSGLVQPMPGSLLAGHVIGAGSVVTLGLALLLEGPALLLSFTVQALGLSLLALRSRDRWLWSNVGVLATVVGSWTVVGIVIGIDRGLAWPDAVAYLVVLLVAGAMAVATRSVSRHAAGSVAVAAWVALLLWIVAVVKPLPQGQMIVSLLWAALGAGVVMVGSGLLGAVGIGPDDSTALRQVGLATLAATVIKLVTIDLAEVDTIWRALLFSVVGAGLLRLGFRIGAQPVPTADLGEKRTARNRS